jgi:8-oxo-dGTP pyrophosphatase MutT (NUDIX family)
MSVIDEKWYKRQAKGKENLCAGGLVVRFDKKRPFIALVREKENFDYILPKGKVEKGETLEAAAEREILEEAGISELKLIQKLAVSERMNFKMTAWKVIHYFLFTTTQEQGVPTDKNHNYHLEWFPIDQLPDIFWPEQQQIINDNIKIIKKLKS